MQPPSEVVVACPAALADNAEAVLHLSDMKRGRVIALPAGFNRACFYMPLGVPSTGDLLTHVLPDIKNDYLTVLLPGQEWTELHAGAGLRRIAETDADILVSGALKERLDQPSGPVPPARELLLPDSHSYAALVNNSIQPVLAALLFKTAFVRAMPPENIKFMDCNFLGSLLRCSCAAFAPVTLPSEEESRLGKALVCSLKTLKSNHGSGRGKSGISTMLCALPLVGPLFVVPFCPFGMSPRRLRLSVATLSTPQNAP